MRLFSLDPPQKLVVLFAFYWRRGATQQLGWISPTQRLEVGFHHGRWWGLPRAKCFFFDKGEVRIHFVWGEIKNIPFCGFLFYHGAILDISTTSFCWWFFKPGRKKVRFCIAFCHDYGYRCLNLRCSKQAPLEDNAPHVSGLVNSDRLGNPKRCFLLLLEEIRINPACTSWYGTYIVELW